MSFLRKDLSDCLHLQCQQHFHTTCKDFGIQLIRFNGTQGILRCTQLNKDQTLSLLSSISTIKKQKVEITPLGASGTIKSMVQKYFSHENI
jgi:RNase P/RNase MRP subunit POP5